MLSRSLFVGGPGSFSTGTFSGAVTALSFSASQASGSDAFKATVNGARWHVGAGASDYFSSNGTTVTFAGPVAVNSLDVGGGSCTISAAGQINTTQLTISNNGFVFASSGLPIMLSGQMADGASAISIKTGTYATVYANTNARLHSFINNSVEKACVMYDGTVNTLKTAIGTPASGGTIVTGYNGDLRRGAFKITVAFGDWTAAALTKDITLGVLPAKARVVSCIADTTVAYAGIVGPVTLTVGKTAGGAEYLASHTVSGATPVKGLADADMGTLLTRAAAIQGGDLTSAMWTGTTNYQARLTSASGNLSGMNAGSTTFYITIEYY